MTDIEYVSNYLISVYLPINWYVTTSDRHWFHAHKADLRFLCATQDSSLVKYYNFHVCGLHTAYDLIFRIVWL